MSITTQNVITSYSIHYTKLYEDDLVYRIKEYDGVIIPAHVDRESYSMISSFGMIPEEYGFKFLELSKRVSINDFLDKNPSLSKYSFLKSSDAHYLWDILERTFSLDLENKSIA